VAPAGGDDRYFVWCKVECDYKHIYSSGAQPLEPGGGGGGGGAVVTLDEFDALVPLHSTQRTMSGSSSGGGSAVNLRDSVPRQEVELAGDVFVSFFLHRTRRATAAPNADSDELLAEVWLHTSFAGERKRPFNAISI
jgi:hypothetical protein